MGLRIAAEPDVEPITLADLRLHLGIVPYEVDSNGAGDHPHDAMIMAMLAAARTHAEEFTGRSIALKTYELRLDGWPEDTEVELPMPPLVSIESVKYIDADEVEQTISATDYVIDTYEPTAGWLLPASGTTWPTPLAVVNCVRIRYRAGYQVPEPDSSPEDAPDLPGAIRAALLLLVGHFYENREAVSSKALTEVPLAVTALLRPYRVRLGMA
jgi:uncharacterized phiE125 gp8 family phage protein